MHGNIFISEYAPLIACQIMNDVCHPIMRCWAHPRNASDSERCDFVSPTILKHIQRSIFMIGSRAHREREIILSRPLCEEPRSASYIQGSDKEGVIATTLACGNKKSFHVKAVSALILTVSEIRPESTATV